MASRKIQTIASGLLLLLVAALSLGLLAGGCGKKDGAAKPNGNPENSDKDAPPPLLKGWEKPAYALVLSGEMFGYLEPCGCTLESQMGGLAHRADLFRQLREERKWTVAGIDLGDMVTRLPNARNLNEVRTQDRIKLKKTLEGLQKLGYRAVGLGKRELLLALNQPDAFLADFIEYAQDDETEDLRLVSANASLVFRTAGKIEQRNGPRKTITFEIAGKTVGVTSVVGKSVKRKLPPLEADARIDVADLAASLKPALAELKKANPDLLVLLANASFDESEALAKEYPDFHVIVSAGGPEDGYEKPKKIGNTLVISVGAKGKHVGVLGVYPESKDERLKFELVELDRHRFKTDKRMLDLMESYQQVLFDQRNEVFRDIQFGPHPSGAKFVGVDACKDCHKKAYAKWITTKHSHAYQGLIEGRPDQQKAGTVIPRNHDPECLACHVTGWDPQNVQRYDSGFTIEKRTTPSTIGLYTKLKGQQCENCHGPGSRHVEIEEKWAAAKTAAAQDQLRDALRKERLAVQLSKEKVKQEKTCYRCHDLDNSPNFKFDEYWPKVEHKGKD